MSVLTQKIANDLDVDYPVIPVYHSLPKVHKDIFPPPLRPIVAGIGSLGERLRFWIDSYLHLSISPGFIKLLVSIMDKDRWEEKFTWLSCDVTILYRP